MADTLRIYHNREKALERELVKLNTPDISDVNRRIIKEFHNYLFSNGVGQLRITKLSAQLRNIIKVMVNDFDKTTKKEIIDVIAIFNQKTEYTDETKADYRRAIKQFYKWFKDNDIRLKSKNKHLLEEAISLYNYIEKEIKKSSKFKCVDFSNIITDEDINKVIEHCKTVKEKAFLKVLHETGCRAGEFLNLKIKDIILLKNRAMITVDGKTGERRIPLVNSLPYLIQWLDIHPYKNDQNKYLWIGESLSRMYEPLKHKGGQKLIDRCFERAQFLEKKHNFHWFRHSRATLLAPKITESLLCKFMGWTLSSLQVRRYVHLCTEQLENAILEMNGMKDEEHQESEKPQMCICGTINASIARYCYKCGNPLSIGTVVQDQEILKQEVDDRLKVYADIMADPIKREKFEEFKRIFFGK